MKLSIKKGVMLSMLLYMGRVTRHVTLPTYLKNGLGEFP